MKKISIMITSYNLYDYIDEAIQSVVSQEMPCDWELLVGDDGSTDGTIEKIRLWESKYPQNIKLNQCANGNLHTMDGFRAAANRAGLLEKATGDYLIFLDGDDCWLGTEKLKTQFIELEKPENTDCSCCAHNIYKYNISDGTGYNMVKNSIPTRKFSFSQYWGYLYFHTNTILFRKECKEMMLDSLYRGYLNDTFITFIMLQYGKVLYINDVWAQYNITGTGLWTGNGNVYGCFRNMHLYDLEVYMRPQYEACIFRKHMDDFITILDEYSIIDRSKITPLINGLNADIFKKTTLLAKLDNLTFSEKVEKFSIRLRAFGARYQKSIIRRFWGL